MTGSAIGDDVRAVGLGGRDTAEKQSAGETRREGVAARYLAGSVSETEMPAVRLSGRDGRQRVGT
jgi:hypothetical protein